MKILIAAIMVLLPIEHAFAESEFCAARPGQTTPPCVLSQGELMVETEAMQWVRQGDPDVRLDQISIGATQLRLGAGADLELQLAWQPAVTMREVDRASGNAHHTTRTGDVTLGLLYGLSGTDGPIAVQGFVTLPTGRQPVGAGDWGAGARLAINVPLGPKLELGLTPEIDASVNGDGSGRHLTYGGAFGLGYPLAEQLSLGVDASIFRDNDPSGRATNVVTSASLAWQTGGNTQVDIGIGAGLNRNSPDHLLYFGIARRF